VVAVSLDLQSSSGNKSRAAGPPSTLNHGDAQHWRRDRRRCVLPLQDAQIGGQGECACGYHAGCDHTHLTRPPPPPLQIEGRGNGIKTNIVNNVDIAKALERPPECELRYVIHRRRCFSKKRPQLILTRPIHFIHLQMSSSSSAWSWEPRPSSTRRVAPASSMAPTTRPACRSFSSRLSKSTSSATPAATPKPW
jgi:hypothetical protein